MFTRLLVGLDGSSGGDVALEQALVLGRQFRATIVAAGVREAVGAGPDAATLERARARAAAAGLPFEVTTPSGDPAAALAALSADADVILVGRRGRTAPGDALGSTATTLVRTAPGCVMVCGTVPSPLRVVGIAFDGRETSRRALEIAAQFASVAGSTLHVIHANDDQESGQRIVGEAEATLSLREADFTIHVVPGAPGEAVAAVILESGCDAVFAGAHLERTTSRGARQLSASDAEDILQHTDVPVAIQP